MAIDVNGALARLGNDDELYYEFMQIFQQDSVRQMDSLQAGLEIADAKAVHHAAHALKGLSGSLGATEVVAICQTIETLAKGGNLQEGWSLFQSLRTAMLAVEQEMQRLQESGLR